MAVSASLKQVFAVHKPCGENLPDDVAVLAAPGAGGLFTPPVVMETTC